MWVRSGGEVVAVDSELAWVTRLVARAVGEPAGEPATATIRLRVEADTAPFVHSGLRLVTRGTYGDGQRQAVLHNAGGSGFDLAVLAGDPLAVTARYRPGPAVRAANRVLAHRFGLLAGQVLVHYPVLWRAGWRGRVPLHAVTPDELDRLLGSVLTYADESFDTMLEIGFGSAIRREWEWRVKRGEPLDNLRAFQHLI